jgi:hypothetical protein
MATEPPAIGQPQNGGSLHERQDFSKITNEGGDPPEFLSSASALAKEKAWYEYVQYSLEPVGTHNITTLSRIQFFDPYDYGSSLVMEIDDTVTDWSSANSLSMEIQTTNTVTRGQDVSVETISQLETALGTDYSGSATATISEAYSISFADDYNISKTSSFAAYIEATGEQAGSKSYKDTFEFQVEASVGFDSTYVKDNDTWGQETTTEDSWRNVVSVGESIGDSLTVDSGYSLAEEEHNERAIGETTAWSKVADRLSKTTGSIRSDNQTWSTTDSTTISKTYEAGYFNTSGAPLQWKIVRYTVQMPMLYRIQYLIDGEWITSDSGYMLLTTIQGTCRSWLENNTAYYEHWGTGEPVTWNEFWGHFFTKESLIAAYQNKLYPDN